MKTVTVFRVADHFRKLLLIAKITSTPGLRGLRPDALMESRVRRDIPKAAHVWRV